VDFIQRFIFPGSFIPSVSAITDSVRRSTDMKVFHLEDIGPFVRMWDYYLCYCEGGFLERQLGDVQMLLTKPRCRLPAVA